MSPSHHRNQHSSEHTQQTICSFVCSSVVDVCQFTNDVPALKVDGFVLFVIVDEFADS
jgi:hypothetical protein